MTPLPGPDPGRFRPLLAVGLVAALLVYVGCTEPDAPQNSRPAAPATAATKTADPKPPAVPKEPEKAKNAADTKAKPAPPEPFAGWPAPAGALLVSGEQLGYLEPCGCTQGQIGGLLRRYDAAERIRDGRKWPLALVDLGSLIQDPNVSRGGPEQMKVKFNVALKALATLKYDALALSPEDLRIGVDEAVGQFLNMPKGAPKLVAANVTSPALDTKLARGVRVAAGTVKLGVTAVVDPAAIKALKDPSLDLLDVQPIDATLPAVLADLEKDTDTQVLLVQGPPELAKTLAEKYPGFDIVVGTSAYPDPPDDAERLNGGKTLLVTVGQRGKYVGVLGIYPGGTPRFRYQRITLGTNWDGPATAMKKVIEDEFRETLKQQGLVELFPKHQFVNGTPGAKFLGVDACKKCHPNTVEAWAETGHARAFASLEKDPKPNVIYDAECITCHTVGFEYSGGYTSPSTTPQFKNVQCENCHGPGSKHVEAPLDKSYRAPLRVTAEQADKNRLCYRCHDDDNSPHFDFAEYWEKVEHNGLDNPKEHMSQPAKPVGN